MGNIKKFYEAALFFSETFKIIPKNVVYYNIGSHSTQLVLLLRSESPGGMCAKLHTLAASDNRDHPTRSLSSSLLQLQSTVCHVHKHC